MGQDRESDLFSAVADGGLCFFDNEGGVNIKQHVSISSKTSCTLAIRPKQVISHCQ
jgi:hypothetical protein